jgi:hydroxyacyl-ACP dehydratase HTD2-like protein with hotdog domain
MNNHFLDSISGSLPAGIPELRVTPDSMQIFMFSAVTWNRHHIHYSKDGAICEGLPDVVVQRALIGNFFARLLTNFMGEHGEIRALSWKVLNSATPGKGLCCRGEVIAREEQSSTRFLLCDVHMIDEGGNTIATGNAKLELLMDR